MCQFGKVRNLRNIRKNEDGIGGKNTRLTRAQTAPVERKLIGPHAGARNTSGPVSISIVGSADLALDQFFDRSGGVVRARKGEREEECQRRETRKHFGVEAWTWRKSKARRQRWRRS